jgi:uracil-DNA glycosylase
MTATKSAQAVLSGECEGVPSGKTLPQLDRLQAWQPECWPVAADWQPWVDGFWSGAAGLRLAGFVQQRLAAGAVVYPPQPLRALALTPLAQVKVVILGQDPYHRSGQAEGLAFSVPDGQKLPPSLRNIFKELQRDLGLPVPVSGSLVRWAEQGVLLLNTCLTVEEGAPASHASQGWEVLTDALIQAVAQAGRPVVFMLWGAHAQAKRQLIEACAPKGLQQLLWANHPSPLSARRPPVPFLGCGHFGQVQRFLECNGLPLLMW